MLHTSMEAILQEGYMLERLQRRAAKIIPNPGILIRNESKRIRRLRGDKIEVFKILTGFENSDRNRTVNEWNRLSADCVGASSIYLRRAGYT